MTLEHKILSQAASFGAPAASTNAAIAVENALIAAGMIKHAGYGQNSMTARYRITDAGRVRLAEMNKAVA